MIYAFGEFQLDEQCYELRCRGVPVKIEPKALSALVYLVRYRDRVVTKDELIGRLWSNETVTDSSLTYCIWGVRKALDQGVPGKQAIKTLHRRGYRFMATVEETVSQAAGAGGVRPVRRRPGVVPAQPTALVMWFPTTVSDRAQSGEPEAWLASRYFRTIARRLVNQHEGREIHSADDRLVADFPAPSPAVGCAMQIQHRLTQEALARPKYAAEVRIGLHCEPSPPSSSLNARVMAAATAICTLSSDRQVLVSEPVRRGAPDANGVRFTELGSTWERSQRDLAPIYEVTRSSPPTVAWALGEALGSEIPFVGRDTELQRLCALVEGTVDGHGGVAVVTGEPGVGKTRLAMELGTYAADRGMWVLRGACYEAGGPSNYGSFSEVLAAVVELLPERSLEAFTGEEAGRIARVAPGMHARLGDLPVAPSLPAERERDLVLDSVVRFLQRAARERPLLLVAEDLHWAERSTVVLLRRLAREVAASRLLLIATFRDSEVDDTHPLSEALPELYRQASTHFLPLASLDEQGVRRMLAASAVEEPPVHVVSAIYRETQGNPLFVEEFVKFLLEEGQLVDGGGGWRSSLNLKAGDVPNGIRLVIGRRLARLGRSTRQMLRTAAVIGRRFRYDLLEEASDLDFHDLLAAVDEAERAQLLASSQENRYAMCAFRHEMIAHVLYQELSLPYRQRLHRRIAEILELVYAFELEAHAGELAYHYGKAGSACKKEKTRHFLSLAGDQAMAASAFEEAVHRYEQAAQLSSPNTTGHAELLLKTGEAQSRAGASDDAVATLEQVAALYERLGDHSGTERACLALTRLHGWRGKFSEMEASLQRGLLATPESTSESRCRLLAIAGKWLMFGGQPGAANDAIENALRIATPRGDQALLGAVLATKGGNQWAYTAFTEAEDTLCRAASLLRAAGDSSALLLCCTDYIVTLGYLGRLDELDGPLLELRSLARKLGDRGTLAIHHLFRGILALAWGNLADAERWSREAEAIACRGARLVLPGILQFAGHVAFLTGDWDRVEPRLEEAIQLNTQMGSPPVRYVGPLTQAYIRAFRGDRAGAYALLGNAPTAPVDDTPMSCAVYDGFVARAQVFALLSLPQPAAALYPSLSAVADRGAVFGSASYPLLQRILGMIAATNHWRDRAQMHYEKALRQAEALRAENELAHTAYWFARFLIGESSAHHRTRALASRALDLYGKMGMPQHRERADRLLSTVRNHSRRYHATARRPLE